MTTVTEPDDVPLVQIDPNGLPLAIYDAAGNRMDVTAWRLAWAPVHMAGALLLTSNGRPPTRGQLVAVAEDVERNPETPEPFEGSRAWLTARAARFQRERDQLKGYAEQLPIERAARAAVQEELRGVLEALAGTRDERDAAYAEIAGIRRGLAGIGSIPRTPLGDDVHNLRGLADSAQRALSTSRHALGECQESVEAAEARLEGARDDCARMAAGRDAQTARAERLAVELDVARLELARVRLELARRQGRLSLRRLRSGAWALARRHRTRPNGAPQAERAA